MVYKLVFRGPVSYESILESSRKCAKRRGFYWKKTCLQVCNLLFVIYYEEKILRFPVFPFPKENVREIS